MRQIDEKTKELIISILNCQETDAIYIFGSYEEISAKIGLDINLIKSIRNK